MARTRCPIVVLSADGKPLAGASVQTNLRPSGSPASVFAAETGATAGSNPATTDAHGKVVQWLERGAYQSVISATGMETYTEPWDSSPGGDKGVDHDWLAVTLQERSDAVPALVAAIPKSGTHAARPSAVGGPLFYYETDTDLVFVNTATGWRLLPLGSSKSIIATEQSRENAAYGQLTTPDEVAVTIPENGLIAVGYQATWKESVVEAARAAIFVDGNQLRVAGSAAEPNLVSAATRASEANRFGPIASCPIGLVALHSVFAYGGDVTTGQAVGIAASLASVDVGGEVKEVGSMGGYCQIFAAAGNHNISVQYKASSGKVTVKNRKLWAWVVA